MSKTLENSKVKFLNGMEKTTIRHFSKISKRVNNDSEFRFKLHIRAVVTEFTKHLQSTKHSLKLSSSVK